MNINMTPFPTTDDNWNYGFIILTLPQCVEDSSNYNVKLTEFIDRVTHASKEYNHNVNFSYSIEKENMTVSARGYYTMNERQVIEKLQEGGLNFPVLMTPSEQDLFLNENIVNRKVINRIYNANSNREAERMSQRAFEKCLEKLNTTIED